MSKNEKDWFATLAGEKVVGMDSNTRLQARLVRNVLKKTSDEIKKEINTDDEQLRKVFITKLEKVGYLKKESPNLEQKITNNIIDAIPVLIDKKLDLFASTVNNK